MRREKITIAFASVIEALFLLLEIYFMIHAKGNFPVLLIVAICMVAVLFFLVLSIIELNQKNKENERQEYADIYKAQKASYLAQKKYFDELNERLNQLEENTNFPAEDIITAQKAVAKVTISRSKENADALMDLKKNWQIIMMHCFASRRHYCSRQEKSLWLIIRVCKTSFIYCIRH